MEIYPVAIVAVVSANAVIGMLWFGPLFGQAWMKCVGKSAHDMKNADMKWPMARSIVGAIITAIVFDTITSAMEIASLSEYLLSAFGLWVGFTGVSSLVNTAYRGSTCILWKIEQGFWLVTYLVMAVIYALL